MQRPYDYDSELPQKTMDVKKRVDIPLGWGLLGAVIGAGVGALLMRKAFSVREQRTSLMLAVGSFALSVFTSLIFPVSNRERRLIEPAKSRESSTLGNLGSSEGLMGFERPGIVGSDRSDALASPTGSRIPPVPPLDDLSTKIH